MGSCQAASSSHTTHTTKHKREEHFGKMAELFGKRLCVIVRIYKQMSGMNLLGHRNRHGLQNIWMNQCEWEFSEGEAAVGARVCGHTVRESVATLRF